jgi:hypothetical protein
MRTIDQTNLSSWSLPLQNKAKKKVVISSFSGINDIGVESKMVGVGVIVDEAY